MKSYTGFLYSQIGYNHDQPKRFLIRGNSGALPDEASFSITENDKVMISAPMTYWGNIWGSHWWVGDFSKLTTCGSFSVTVTDKSRTVFSCDDLRIAEDILWHETFENVALGQLERRNNIAHDDNGVKEGWFDAGMPWQEANSHAAMLLGLCDALELQAERLTLKQLERLKTQIKTGAEYLIHLQNIATEKGHKPGACVHQSFNFRELVLPSDVAKLSGALARVANTLNDESCTLYRQRATAAMEWVLNDADYASLPFLAAPHRLPEGILPPKDIHTSDLVMLLLCAIETEDERAPHIAKEWLSRQISPEESHNGVYGHFYLWNDTQVIERNWWHGVAEEGMGYNNGQTLGHNLLVLIRLIIALPDHPDNATWLKALKDYCFGYFIPGCKANPFYLMPNIHYSDEGFICFAGLWHGANAIYGNAAALAMELYDFFKEEDLLNIATGNMQWLCGLNAGITKDSLTACDIYSTDIEEGVALPASQFQGIGNRWSGGWLNIRGSITNGFCTGQQFKWDIEQTQANDGPFTFTDEDWITHSGGWLSGLSRV